MDNNILLWDLNLILPQSLNHSDGTLRPYFSCIRILTLSWTFGDYLLMSHYFPLFYWLFLCHFWGLLVLNCILLGHFPQLGFIGPLSRIFSYLALIGLIIVCNYF